MTRNFEALESRVLLSGTFLSQDQILGRAGDALFYAAFQSDTGQEPTFIRSTGTKGVLLKDIRPGARGSNPQFVAEIGDVLFFSANDGTGAALWRTGGNIKTTKVTAVAPDTSIRAVAINGTLYFAGSDAQHPHALWKTDGTPGNATFLHDYGADPHDLTAYKRNLWFIGDRGTDGEIIWKTDGTPAGTVTAGGAGFNGPTSLVATKDYLYYLDTKTPGNNQHLWRKDGSGDALMQTAAGLNQITDLTAKGETVYFIEFDPLKNCDALFRNNGTIATGTKRLRNLNDHGTIIKRDHSSPVSDALDVEQTNAASGFASFFSVEGDVVTALTPFRKEQFAQPKQIGGDLYFARVVDGGQQLWRANDLETMRLKRFPGAQFLGGFTAFGSNVLFTDSDKPLHGSSQPIGGISILWTTDGTAGGTHELYDFNSAATLILADSHILDQRLYFTIVDYTGGTPLWFTDATPQGTNSVK
jgi:ELWxxDGT repeat protein